MSYFQIGHVSTPDWGNKLSIYQFSSVYDSRMSRNLNVKVPLILPLLQLEPGLDPTEWLVSMGLSHTMWCIQMEVKPRVWFLRETKAVVWARLVKLTWSGPLMKQQKALSIYANVMMHLCRLYNNVWCATDESNIYSDDKWRMWNSTGNAPLQCLCTLVDSRKERCGLCRDTRYVCATQTPETIFLSSMTKDTFVLKHWKKGKRLTMHLQRTRYRPKSSGNKRVYFSKDLNTHVRKALPYGTTIRQWYISRSSVATVMRCNTTKYFCEHGGICFFQQDGNTIYFDCSENKCNRHVYTLPVSMDYSVYFDKRTEFQFPLVGRLYAQQQVWDTLKSYQPDQSICCNIPTTPHPQVYEGPRTLIRSTRWVTEGCPHKGQGLCNDVRAQYPIMFDTFCTVRFTAIPLAVEWWGSDAEEVIPRIHDLCRHFNIPTSISVAQCNKGTLFRWVHPYWFVFSSCRHFTINLMYRCRHLDGVRFRDLYAMGCRKLPPVWKALSPVSVGPVHDKDPGLSMKDAQHEIRWGDNRYTFDQPIYTWPKNSKVKKRTWTLLHSTVPIDPYELVICSHVKILRSYHIKKRTGDVFVIRPRNRNPESTISKEPKRHVFL